MFKQSKTERFPKTHGIAGSDEGIRNSADNLYVYNVGRANKELAGSLRLCSEPGLGMLRSRPRAIAGAVDAVVLHSHAEQA